MYTVYILHSLVLNRYYIGYTTNEVETRLNKHLSNHRGFTSKVKDWYICYTEIFSTKKEAMQREQDLKNWKSAVRIKELIQHTSKL